jgi:hypothetical protein
LDDDDFGNDDCGCDDFGCDNDDVIPNPFTIRELNPGGKICCSITDIACDTFVENSIRSLSA